jgi:hypothetical protein
MIVRSEEESSRQAAQGVALGTCRDEATRKSMLCYSSHLKIDSKVWTRDVTWYRDPTESETKTEAVSEAEAEMQGHLCISTSLSDAQNRAEAVLSDAQNRAEAEMQRQRQKQCHGCKVTGIVHDKSS